jgi:hypothetical protein
MYKQSVDGQMRSQVDSGKEIMKLLDDKDNHDIRRVHTWINYIRMSVMHGYIFYDYPSGTCMGMAFNTKMVFGLMGHEDTLKDDLKDSKDDIECDKQLIMCQVKKWGKAMDDLKKDNEKIPSLLNAANQNNTNHEMKSLFAISKL